MIFELYNFWGAKLRKFLNFIKKHEATPFFSWLNETSYIFEQAIMSSEDLLMAEFSGALSVCDRSSLSIMTHFMLFCSKGKN